MARAGNISIARRLLGQSEPRRAEESGTGKSMPGLMALDDNSDL